MKPQLSLLEPLSAQTSSLFFALFPDAETAATLSGFAQQLSAQHGLKGKIPGAERFHVSLQYLGEYEGDLPENTLAAARRAAAALTAPAFEVVFDHVRSFPKERQKPFVLVANEENAELKAFHRTLGQALASAGLGRWVKPAYTPHLTLLYDNRQIATQPVAPVRWSANEFVLVRSLVGKSHYEHLDSWPLRAPA